MSNSTDEDKDPGSYWITICMSNLRGFAILSIVSGAGTLGWYIYRTGILRGLL